MVRLTGTILPEGISEMNHDRQMRPVRIVLEYQHQGKNTAWRLYMPVVQESEKGGSLCIEQ